MKKSEAVKRLNKWAQDMEAQDEFQKMDDQKATETLLDHLVKMGLIGPSWDPEDDEPVCGAV